MLHVVLYEPEIPVNTGNIIRLCANTGYQLHLIEPLGFELDDKRLRRAGLDYHEWVDLRVYSSWNDFLHKVDYNDIYALTTKGQSCYSKVAYQPGDVLLLGPETRGLPKVLLDSLSHHQWIRLPMKPESRSLNLSNATAVVVYESWRQLDFAGSFK